MDALIFRIMNFPIRIKIGGRKCGRSMDKSNNEGAMAEGIQEADCKSSTADWFLQFDNLKVDSFLLNLELCSILVARMLLARVWITLRLAWQIEISPPKLKNPDSLSDREPSVIMDLYPKDWCRQASHALRLTFCGLLQAQF